MVVGEEKAAGESGSGEDSGNEEEVGGGAGRSKDAQPAKKKAKSASEQLPAFSTVLRCIEGKVD